MITKAKRKASKQILKVAHSVKDAVSIGLPMRDALKGVALEVAGFLIEAKTYSDELLASIVSLIASGKTLAVEDFLIRMECYNTNDNKIMTKSISKS